jgi:hypothetical protein
MPDTRLAVLYVAVPEPLRVPGPRAVAPSLKVTVPVSTPEPFAGATVAVKVTFTPRSAVADEDATVVVVASIATVTEIGLDVDDANLRSPEYCAVIESVPTGRGVVSVATPEAFSVAVPSAVVPERKVTVPVGIVAVPVGPDTVAVRVTDCPYRGEVLEDRTVIVVADKTTSVDASGDVFIASTLPTSSVAML